MVISFSPIVEQPVRIDEFSLTPLTLPSQGTTLSGGNKLFLYLKNNNIGLLFRNILLYLKYYYAHPNLSISAQELFDLRTFFLEAERGEDDAGGFIFLEEGEECKIII